MPEDHEEPAPEGSPEDESNLPAAPAPEGEGKEGEGDTPAADSGKEPGAAGEDRTEGEDSEGEDVADAGDTADSADAGGPGQPASHDRGAEEGAVEMPDLRPDSVWSPIAADTSGAVRPAPEDVDLKSPILLFLAPIVILALGAVVARELVWEGFLDPYVWDYIVRDAGFNPYNTGMWAILLGLLLFVAYRLVQKIEQPVDFLLIVGTLPYMVGGSVVRVMEDTGYFGEPLRFFFITPIIYVLIFGVAVLWLVIGHVLRAQAKKVGNEAAVQSLAAMLGAIWVLYLAVVLFGDEGTVSFFPSPWVLLFAFGVPLVYFWMHTRQTGRFSQVGAMATFGSAFMLFALYVLVLWHTGARWDELVPKPVDQDASNRFWVYGAMIVPVGVFVALVYLFARKMSARWQSLFVLLLPINMLVIFGQTWDSVSTSIGVDFLGYDEKHTLPSALIGGLAGSGIPVLSEYAASFVMITLKVIVAFAVVFLIDVYSRSDMVKHPDLVGLVKLAIIMVGVVPGTRNMIRMAMGV